MIWHVLASLVVGIGAASEPCLYLTLKKRSYYAVILVVVSLLFFGYGFVPGTAAQLAYALAAFGVGCVLECAFYLEVMSDRVYTAILQYVMSCLGIYLGERATSAYGLAASVLPAGANVHFVSSPVAVAIIAAVNALWFGGMLLAYKTIMRYTPYPDDVYRKAIVMTAPLIPLQLFFAFGGDAMWRKVTPDEFLIAALITAVITLILVVGLSLCVSANSRFVVTTKLDLIEHQNRNMKDYVDSIERLNVQLRSFRHDQRHFIDTLSTLLDASDIDRARKMLDELSERNDSLATREYSTNGTINAMLLDAAARSRAIGTSFDVTVRAADEILIDDSDLVALIKNMLENAVEACAKLERPRDGRIAVKIVAEHGMFLASCANTVDKPPEIKNDRIKTSKSEGNRMHGIGIESMHLVAEKYDGHVSLGVEDGMFEVSAYLDNKAV